MKQGIFGGWLAYLIHREFLSIWVERIITGHMIKFFLGKSASLLII